MLEPAEFTAAAERVFSAPQADAAALKERLEFRPVRAAASPSFRLFHQESPAPIPPTAPVFGEPPPLAAPRAATTRVWNCHNVRILGRRGLLAEDGALFLGGPLRTEDDLARAATASAAGNEGLVLRGQAKTEARALTPISAGDRRATGVGLHLGTAANGRPFLLEQFAALLLIAELKPRIDYLVAPKDSPELADILPELGLDKLKRFDLDIMQGVICNEILAPVIAHDPTGWVDSATIGRMRKFAAAAHAKLGAAAEAETIKVFLTHAEDADTPAARAARRKNYQIRTLKDRSIVDCALLMAKASRIATDIPDAVLITLFAASEIPVLDLAGGEKAARVPYLASTGRPYALAEPHQSEQAFEAFDK